jgi:hypothetical protein
VVHVPADLVSTFAQYGVAGLGLLVAAIAVYRLSSARRQNDDITASVGEAVGDAIQPLVNELRANTAAIVDLRVAVGELKGRINGRRGPS